jgi:hypothetical protein
MLKEEIPMSDTHPNIFAHELATILQHHHHLLMDLAKSPFSLERRKVSRLEKSFYSTEDGPEELPALNQIELMTITMMLKLNDDERFRLYAALIALGSQRMLLQYLSPQRAWEIACEVRNAAYEWLKDHRNDSDLFPRRRTVQGNSATGQHGIFADILDAYDEGVALSALGLFDSVKGKGLLRQALVCLERADYLLDLLPDSIQSGEDWHYWHQQVQAELATVRGELE